MGVHRPRPRLTYGFCTAANPTTGAADTRTPHAQQPARIVRAIRAEIRLQHHEAKKLDLLDAVSGCSPTHAALHEATEAVRDTVVPDLLLEYVKDALPPTDSAA